MYLCVGERGLIYDLLLIREYSSDLVDQKKKIINNLNYWTNLNGLVSDSQIISLELQRPGLHLFSSCPDHLCFHNNSLEISQHSKTFPVWSLNATSILPIVYCHVCHSNTLLLSLISISRFFFNIIFTPYNTERIQGRNSNRAAIWKQEQKQKSCKSPA